MTFERLETTPFVSILHDIFREKRTGYLTIARHELRKTLYWSQGDLVLAASTAAEDSLEDLLVRKGVATTEQAAELSMHDPTETVTSFHEAKLAGPDQRVALLREWMISISHPLFSFEEGTAVFTEAAPIDPEKRIFLLSTAGWVLEGVRSITSGLLIRRSLGDIKRLIAPARDPIFTMDRLPLTVVEGHIATALTQPETIENFLKRFGSESLNAARVAIAMMTLGVFAVVEKEKRSASDAGEMQRDLELLAAVGPDDQRSLRAISFARQLDHMDYYQVLDLPRGVTRPQIIARGEELKKQYTPTIYPPPVRESVQRISKEIDHAVHALSDPVRRHEYDKLLSGASPDREGLSMSQLLARRSIAAQNFRRADELAVQGDYYGAIVLLKQTVEYAPDNAEAWYLLATCQLKNPKWHRDAVDSLVQATNIDPNHVEALLALGELYKGERMLSRAMACFEDVIKIDPENARAKQRLKELKEK